MRNMLCTEKKTCAKLNEFSLSQHELTFWSTLVDPKLPKRASLIAFSSQKIRFLVLFSHWFGQQVLPQRSTLVHQMQICYLKILFALSSVSIRQTDLEIAQFKVHPNLLWIWKSLQNCCTFIIVWSFWHQENCTQYNKAC